MKSQLKQWVRGASIRAAKTAAQSALGIIGASAYMGGVKWVLVASGAALAAIVSLLTSVVGIPEAADGKSIAQIGNE